MLAGFLQAEGLQPWCIGMLRQDGVKALHDICVQHDLAICQSMSLFVASRAL